MSYETQVLADSPDEVWRCDTAGGTELGIVASRPMALFGAPLVQQDGPFDKETSYAIALNGSTQYLDFGTPNEIDAIWQNGGTLEYWVKVDGTQAGVLIGKQRVTSTPIGWDTRAVNHAAGEFQFQFTHRFVNGGANQGVWLTDDTFVLGTWCHVVVVYNYDSPANTPTVYVEKVARALTTAQTPAGSRLSDESYFGRAADDANSGGRQAMSVSWVAWYKTTQLSAARVEAHYDSAVKGGFVEPGILGFPTVIADSADGQGGDHDLIELDLGALLDKKADRENGFVDRADSTIAFTDGTRTFTITPVGDSFQYYHDRTSYTVTSADSVVISDVEGLHYVYYDGATLTETTGFIDPLIILHALVAAVYWNATHDESVMFADERHGNVMDWATHIYNHSTTGARYGTGFAVGNMDVDGNGDDASAAQFSVSDGIFWDEDIEHVTADGLPQELSPICEIPMYYFSGASAVARRVTATQYPITTAGSGRAAWNKDTAGTWTLEEVANNDFVLTHYAVTGSVVQPVIGIVGQSEYATQSDAREGALVELRNITLGNIEALTPEFFFFASVIWQTSNGYTNAVKSRVRSTDTGDDYVDWRTSGAGVGTAGGAATTNFQDNEFSIFDETTLFALTFQLSSFSASRQVTGLDAAGVMALSDAALTANSIPYVDASGRLDEDTTFVRDAGKIGIGTSTPFWNVDLHANANGAAVVNIRNTDSGASASSAFRVEDGTAWGLFSQHGAGRTAVRFGVTIAGYSEILHNAGNGLLMGTLDSTPVVIGTNSIAAVNIDTSQNVGIGDTTPTAKLSVSGQVRSFVPGVDDQQFVFGGPDVNWYGRLRHGVDTGTIGTLLSSSGQWAAPGATYVVVKDFVGNRPSVALHFGSQLNGAIGSYFRVVKKAAGATTTDGATTVQLSVTDAGNVGIGTATPSKKLVVEGANVGTDLVQIVNTDADQASIRLETQISPDCVIGACGAADEILTGTEAGDMAVSLRSGGAVRMSASMSGVAQNGLAITANGRVGVGVLAPQNQLHVDAGVTVTGSLAVATPSSANLDWNAGATKIRSYGPDTATFGNVQIIPVKSNGVSRTGVFLDGATGRLGIDTTTPVAMLDVVDGASPTSTTPSTDADALVVRSGAVATGLSVLSNDGAAQKIEMKGPSGTVFDIEHANTASANTMRMSFDGTRAVELDAVELHVNPLGTRLDVRFTDDSGDPGLFFDSQANRVGVATADTPTALHVSGTISSKELDNGNGGTAATVVWSRGSHQLLTLDAANCVLSFSVFAATAGLHFTLVQSTGAGTVTWPTNVKVSGGTMPALSTGAGQKDHFDFYHDGTDFIAMSWQLNPT